MGTAADERDGASAAALQNGAYAYPLEYPHPTGDLMHWVWLGIACVFEVMFALGSNWAQGFTRLWPTVFTVGAAAGGIYTLSLALTVLDVGVGYTIWTGVGSIGTVVFGMILFGEKINKMKVAGFTSIIIGVIGLRLLADV